MFNEIFGKLSTKFGKRNVMIAAVVVGVLVVGGIVRSIERKAANSFAEKAIEAATGGKVDIDSDGGEITVRTDEGIWSTSDKLPDGWPSDVPTYPDTAIQSSVAANQGQDLGHFVGLLTDDGIAKVVDWYKDKLADEGWKIETDLTVTDGSMLGASKDSRSLIVTIMPQDGKTIINLTVAAK